MKKNKEFVYVIICDIAFIMLCIFNSKIMFISKTTGAIALAILTTLIALDTKESPNQDNLTKKIIYYIALGFGMICLGSAIFF